MQVVGVPTFGWQVVLYCYSCTAAINGCTDHLKTQRGGSDMRTQLDLAEEEILYLSSQVFSVLTYSFSALC